MREHGTYAKYKLDNCRCYPCAGKASEYNANRDRAIAYGTWQPLVDAEPVRQHVRRLMECGIGTRRIAELGEVSRSQLQKLLTGKIGGEPTQRMRPDGARRLLTIEPTLENIAPSTPIDSTGTHRRLQALVTIGWSQAKLSDRLGLLRSNFGALMKSSQVTAARALQVRALYDELWDQVPPEMEHREKIAASRARNYAKAHGWVPPMAWDDASIDDPATVADLGEKTDRPAALFEDSEELFAQGHTLEQASERLGVTRNTLQKARERARRRRQTEAAA